MGTDADYSVSRGHPVRRVARTHARVGSTALGLQFKDHAVYVLDSCTPCPWLAKIDGEMYPAKYMFTVDYTNNEIADDPAQHKQSHVMELLDAGEWTGNIVALPNNRVRVTHPAWFEMGGGRTRLSALLNTFTTASLT